MSLDLTAINRMGGDTAKHGLGVARQVQPPMFFWDASKGIPSMNIKDFPEMTTLDGKTIKPVQVKRADYSTGAYKSIKDEVVGLVNPKITMIHVLSSWRVFDKATNKTAYLFSPNQGENGVLKTTENGCVVADKIDINKDTQKMATQSQMYCILSCDTHTTDGKTGRLFKNKLVRFSYGGETKFKCMRALSGNLNEVILVINNALKNAKMPNRINLSNLEFELEPMPFVAGGEDTVGFKIKGGLVEYTEDQAAKFLVNQKDFDKYVKPALKKVQELYKETTIYMVEQCQTMLNETGKFPKNAEQIQQVLSGNTDSLLIEHDDDVPLEVDNNFNDDVPM